MGERRIRLDCAGRTAGEVLAKLTGELERGFGRVVTLNLENLRETGDSVGRVLREILSALRERGLEGRLIDPSGCADAFVRLVDPRRPLDILVVEDTPDSLDFLRSLLEGAGHRVTGAETGRRAILEAGRRTFDLILLDLLLPDMDGLQVARALSGSPAPIIAMSAYLERWSEDELRRVGLHQRLRKPFKSADLLAALPSPGAVS
ncbi:MAG TPA: response regulator [Planctomycetota bacterium]